MEKPTLPQKLSVKELKEILSKYNDEDIVILSSWMVWEGACGAFLSVRPKDKAEIDIMQEGDDL